MCVLRLCSSCVLGRAALEFVPAATHLLYLDIEELEQWKIPPFMITFPASGLSYSSLTQWIEVHVSSGQQGNKLPLSSVAAGLQCSPPDGRALKDLLISTKS